MADADPNVPFRERRRQARRRRQLTRAVVLGVLLALAAAVALGARAFEGPEGKKEAKRADRAPARARRQAAPQPRPLPREIRGVHVTMALASLPGKLDEYARIPGLNTIELDVKDENGEVGFTSPGVPLARAVRAARSYYDPMRIASRLHRRGIYLIGRIVVFEDPILAEARPGLAVRTADGSVWRNHAGLAWTNPYDRRVWRYNVDIAVAAARAGFDEIQFDYVRFPSDGDITAIRYPGRHAQPMGWTIPAFLQYARGRLKPLRVRLSVDVFGLSAARDLGIGQFPRRMAALVDAVYPMVYPSHYHAGEYGIPDPNAAPGLTVRRSLAEFVQALEGRRVKLIPWLQDFSLGRTYTLEDVRLQIAAARALGASGFLLWNPEGVYTEGALR